MNTSARSPRPSLPSSGTKAPRQHGAAGGDAPAERLQHRRFRQVARDRGLGTPPARPIAGRHELRQLGLVTLYFLFCCGLVLTLTKLFLAQWRDDAASTLGLEP
jgi:hypothetical protein